MEAWIKEGKLKSIKPGTTWNTIRSTVEDLLARLHKIKDRDPITSAYKYLDDFIKDESLINNLHRVKDVLNRHEPKIEISPFGAEKNASANARRRTGHNTIVV